MPEWTLAVVLDSSDDRPVDRPAAGAPGVGRDRQGTRRQAPSARTTWASPCAIVVDGKTVKAKSPADVLKPGDVIFVQKNEGPTAPTACARCRRSRAAWSPWIRTPAACWPWSAASPMPQSEFNRATQAMRQPGSSFKPIVYSAALDNGYTPASVVIDGPITIKSGNTTWTPKNYDGTVAGPATLRSGIEKSRNLMTVRLANDMGMKLVAEYAERFGVYDHLPPVSADGAGLRRDDRHAHGLGLCDHRQWRQVRSSRR